MTPTIHGGGAPPPASKARVLCGSQSKYAPAQHTRTTSGQGQQTPEAPAELPPTRGNPALIPKHRPPPVTIHSLGHATSPLMLVERRKTKHATGWLSQKA